MTTDELELSLELAKEWRNLLAVLIYLSGLIAFPRAWRKTTLIALLFLAAASWWPLYENDRKKVRAKIIADYEVMFCSPGIYELGFFKNRLEERKKTIERWGFDEIAWGMENRILAKGCIERRLPDYMRLSREAWLARIAAERQKRLAREAAARPYLVTFYSDPPGADLWIDGEWFGRTPTSVHLGSDTYSAKIIRRGFKHWDYAFDTRVVGQRKFDVRATLVPQDQ